MTSTNKHILFDVEQVPAGVHINALGADTIGKTEPDPHLLTLSKIIVEYLPQTSTEGEVQNVPLHHVDAECGGQQYR